MRAGHAETEHSSPAAITAAAGQFHIHAVDTVEQALASLKRSCDVTIYTDSEYVRNGITTWIHNWKRRGWRTADCCPGSFSITYPIPNCGPCGQ